MKNFLTAIFLSIILLFTISANAQKFANNEIVEHNRQKFIMHTVYSGETLYSISKKFKVEQSVLNQYNPNLKKGLQVGQVIKIPYVEGVDLSEGQVSQKGQPSGFIRYKVKKKKETAYSIAKKYGVTVEEIYKYNPGVTKLKKRMILNIPFWDEKEETPVIDDEQTITHTVVSGETLYSLSKKYGISESEILEANPNAANLKTGMVLSFKKKAEKEEISSDSKYFTHIIESGETLWSLTRKYNVTESELKTMNPLLETAFPAGAEIKIPVHNIEKTTAIPVNSNAFIKHNVEKGETLYSLSKNYNVTIPELKKYNPVLQERNLVCGEVILVPNKTEDLFDRSLGDVDSVKLADQFFEVKLPVEIPESCLPGSVPFYSGKTYNIALFLPLFYSKNSELNDDEDSLALSDSLLTDTLVSNIEEMVDTLVSVDEDLEDENDFNESVVRFYGNSENFMQFYEGVLLAVDSLENAGVKINLNVYDTQRDLKTIRSIFTSDKFFNTDLIIGPIYPQVQKEIAAYSYKNHIPIVSPLAANSNISKSNPCYFQVNPTRDYLVEETADMIAESFYNTNIIVLKMGRKSASQNNMINLLREKLQNFGTLNNIEGLTFAVCDFDKDGVDGLTKVMSDSLENVVYIVSESEGDVSVAISNLNNLIDDFAITVVGSNRYSSFSSIQLEQFHNLKLTYIAPYWTDYGKLSTINYITKFKSNFSTEPNNFGFQGYDVTMYFMSALLAYGHDFENCLPYFHTIQTQGNYHFEKLSQFGGYMNKGVSVISYTRDYEVVRKRIKGQPRFILSEGR